MQEPELRALMVASLDGNAAAHRELLNRLSRHLRAYYKSRLARLGQSATDAEDLVQETLMAIHTRRETYDRGEPLTPWIHAIARYKLIDHLRQVRPFVSDVPLDGAEDVLARDDHVRVESAYDLKRLLARLPEKMQRAIECVKLDGLSVAETAARYGTSESSVKVSVHRGLKALAALIARENSA